MNNIAKKPQRTDLNEYNWQEFYEEVQNESPRAAVIISGAFLDNLLRDLIASFMINNKKIVDELLGTEQICEAPLSSFGARIKTAYCLRLIDKLEYEDLKLIQKIRNRFAHKMHGYSFQDPEIIKWCNLFQSQNNPALLKFKKTHGDNFLLTVSGLVNRIGLQILSLHNGSRM
jgi:DNA-binding MltR family transcriptional regulator